MSDRRLSGPSPHGMRFRYESGRFSLRPHGGNGERWSAPSIANTSKSETVFARRSISNRLPLGRERNTSMTTRTLQLLATSTLIALTLAGCAPSEAQSSDQSSPQTETSTGPNVGSDRQRLEDQLKKLE